MEVLNENGRTTKELSVGGENKNIDVLMHEGISGETKVDRYLQRIIDGNASIELAYSEVVKDDETGYEDSNGLWAELKKNVFKITLSGNDEGL